MLVETLFNATLVGAEWVLYLLIVLSIISVAIMVERSITLIRSRINTQALQDNLRIQLNKGDVKGAISDLQGHNAAEARICLSGLVDMQKGIGAVEENIAAATNVEKERLEKNLSFLGTVGSNAPFIGLFGTVMGIIKAFHDLSLGSKEGAAAVMAGISEALVATAVGLMVAIPAVVAFNVFKRKASRRLSNADTLSRVLFAHLKAN